MVLTVQNSWRWLNLTLHDNSGYFTNSASLFTDGGGHFKSCFFWLLQIMVKILVIVFLAKRFLTIFLLSFFLKGIVMPLALCLPSLAKSKSIGLPSTNNYKNVIRETIIFYYSYHKYQVKTSTFSKRYVNYILLE